MLPISNVINVSVAEAPLGLGDYNVNNLAMLSSDAPIPEDYGTYGAYVSPAAVADDYGVDSETYLQAVAIFSQNPNVLNGDGQLIIFPRQNGLLRTVAVAAGGTGYVVGDVLTIVQTGGEDGTVTVATVSGGVVTGVTITTKGNGYSAASGRSTTGGTGSGCTITITTATPETLLEEFTRIKDIIFFAGIISTFAPADDTTAQAFSDAIQAEPLKMWFFPTADFDDVAGIFTDIKDASNSKTRCLYYGQDDAQAARIMAAAYAGKGMSVNFDLTDSVLTMSLKNLTTILPDETVTQTKLGQLETAGVDCYVSYSGVPSVVSNGANRYYDEVYCLLWFVSALQVAGFNALRQVSSKVPQTEPGVTLLKDAYRQVCEAAKNNGYIAPGSWTSPERFGNPEDMLQNILQRGYYIYSLPVNQQSSEDRAARKAPPIRIGIKESGAVQESDVVVNVNA